MNTKPIKKALRPCREFGCNKLTREAYCETHKKKAQKRQLKKQRENRNKEIDSFYRTKEWRRLRLVALSRDKHLCQWCKKKGLLIQADVVHHIIEITEDWSQRLVLDNLVSLCHLCHNRHHKTAPRG